MGELKYEWEPVFIEKLQAVDEIAGDPITFIDNETVITGEKKFKHPEELS